MIVSMFHMTKGKWPCYRYKKGWTSGTEPLIIPGSILQCFWRPSSNLSNQSCCFYLCVFVSIFWDSLGPLLFERDEILLKVQKYGEPVLKVTHIWNQSAKMRRCSIFQLVSFGISSTRLIWNFNHSLRAVRKSAGTTKVAKAVGETKFQWGRFLVHVFLLFVDWSRDEVVFFSKFVGNSMEFPGFVSNKGPKACRSSASLGGGSDSASWAMGQGRLAEWFFCWSNQCSRWWFETCKYITYIIHTITYV